MLMMMVLMRVVQEVVVDDLQCPVQTITRMSSSPSPPSAATSSPRAASTEGCALAAAACTAAPSAGVEGGVSGGVSARIRWLKKSCAHRFPEPGYSQPEIIAIISAGPYRGEEGLVLLRPGDGLDAVEGGLRAGAVSKSDCAAAPYRHELLRLAEIEREGTSVSPTFIGVQKRYRQHQSTSTSQLRRTSTRTLRGGEDARPASPCRRRGRGTA